MPTKIESDTKQRLEENWPDFLKYRSGTESHQFNGRSLNESDVRAVLERLLTDVLGYEPSQIDREPDFADFLILYRGMKLVVIETKDWGMFRNHGALVEALKQAAGYADRHKVKYMMAFDAEKFVLAERKDEEILVLVDVTIPNENVPGDLFYFSHYGLSKVGPTSLSVIQCPPEERPKSEFKRHHKVDLHYTCFAYVGDLRDKSTWKMPYRNPDGSVDTGRIDKAVGYLLTPSGYRGVRASNASVPEAAQPEAARRLAQGFKEIEKWASDSPSKAARTLWEYLDSRGETDLH